MLLQEYLINTSFTKCCIWHWRWCHKVIWGMNTMRVIYMIPSLTMKKWIMNICIPKPHLQGLWGHYPIIQLQAETQPKAIACVQFSPSPTIIAPIPKIHKWYLGRECSKVGNKLHLRFLNVYHLLYFYLVTSLLDNKWLNCPKYLCICIDMTSPMLELMFISKGYWCYPWFHMLSLCAPTFTKKSSKILI